MVCHFFCTLSHVAITTGHCWDKETSDCCDQREEFEKDWTLASVSTATFLSPEHSRPLLI